MNIKEKIIDYRFFKEFNSNENYQINDNDYFQILNDETNLFESIITKSIEEVNILLDYNSNENSFYSSLELNELLFFRKSLIGINKEIDKVNFFTISSKENFTEILLTNEEEEKVWNDSIVFFPLNDHSRSFLSKGDVLFCNRIGQFENLSEALNTRGIYGLGIALTDPIEFFPDETGHNKYGVVVCFPLSLKKSLSTRNIQMNPITIDLTPYNGNRNDSLQLITEREKAIELLKMITFDNRNISNLFKVFYNFEIPKIDILPNDYLDLKYNNNKIENQQSTLLEDSKLKNIIFKTFEYLLEQYGENIVLNNYKLKHNVVTGDKSYTAIIIEEFFGTEVLLSVFETEQNINDYQTKGNKRFINKGISLNKFPFSYFTSQWNEKNDRGLSLINFNKLILKVSKNNLQIIRDQNVFKLIKKTKSKSISPLKETKQIIYYGAPGTGKSHKVDYEIKNLTPNFYERITFHPEFDHTSFVGGYRPFSENDIIKYHFVPQAFINIYVRAWNDLDNQYYLVIEEINRGNCAEIFGDIFQLLDRKSNYTVSPSNELKEYLNIALSNKDGINNGLKLPPNLSVLSTMNTSDQSLFPMDSAFKRRWDWEYIPICYDDIPQNESFGYKVILDDDKTSFKWIDFIKNVNAVIKTNPNLGMDKCIGNYFIKSETNEITLKEFINKAVFYLWNDVFKDEDSSDSIFEKGISYEDFFPIDTNGKEKVEKILNDLKIDIIKTVKV